MSNLGKTILVTGGAGFIGSHLIDLLLAQDHRVIVLDSLTYAGSSANLNAAAAYKTFQFVEGDICDLDLVRSLMREHTVDAVMHLAAETHVDNSIEAPGEFIRTNLVGTYTLLTAAREIWTERGRPDDFRFLHVSTDEVFGQLGADDAPFSEKTPYAPSSPYSASKAGSDHLARAWMHTYGLPVIVTNCSNNFGPRQHAEKLIPRMIASALAGKPLPVYGDGSNIRDWLFVKDHCRGLLLALLQGKPGETYCFGGDCQQANIVVVRTLCRHLDAMVPRSSGSYQDLISFVPDRPGHDWRYAIDCSKARAELDYRADTNFETGLRDTVTWYVGAFEIAA